MGNHQRVRRCLRAAAAVVAAAVIAAADTLTVNPVEDISIPGYVLQNGMGVYTFLRFDISVIPAGATIDSAFLVVHQKSALNNWDGDAIFTNVNSQTWTETDNFRDVWQIATSDSTHQDSGFVAGNGMFARSVDLAAIVRTDHNAANTYTSVKIGDPDKAGVFNPIGIIDVDTLTVGGVPTLDPKLSFYSSEAPVGSPRLVIHYSPASFSRPWQEHAHGRVHLSHASVAGTRAIIRLYDVRGALQRSSNQGAAGVRIVRADGIGAAGKPQILMRVR